MSGPIAYVLKSSAGQTLGALSHILKKAESHARAIDVDDEVFLSARLAPDMFPMVRQVQIASDICARGGARLAGAEPSSTPDVETTFAELAGRAETANAFVQALDDAAIEANAEVVLHVPIGQETMPMEGRAFLSNFILPNLHFHAAMAYGLLRGQGVALGKRDFLMPG